VAMKTISFTIPLWLFWVLLGLMIFRSSCDLMHLLCRLFL
jgi:hypothetical protein